MKQATFGLVGLGNISQSQHLPNLTRAPHIHLKTVCDLREDLLSQMQTKYQVPHGTTRFEELLADAEIQAVVIGTQEKDHAAMTIEAVQAGKHVYVEKPLAATIEDCRAIVRASRETGQAVVVGFNRRGAPSCLKAKEIVAQHGGAKHMHYRIADPGRTPERLKILQELSRIYDIARFFAESEAVSVYCAESRFDEESIIIKFENGSVVSILSSGWATRDLPKEYLELFTGDGGTLILDEFVELRTYGIRGVDHIYRFAGHSHPDREFTHKYLFQQEGAAATMRAIRRAYWELQERFKENPNDPAFADNEEVARWVTFKGINPRMNYMVDKGWLPYLDRMGECIANESELTGFALAEDGLRANVIADAAIRSRSSGEVVRISSQ